MLRALFRFLVSRDLWVFFGLVALAFLIWVIGPVIAVGRYRPLEGEFVRIVVIALMFGVWLVRVAYRKWRERRLNAQLLHQLRTPSPKAKEAKPEEAPEIKELHSGFADATAVLKNMRFGPGPGGKAAGRFALFDRQYLYQLPWYIFIGAPGSGKTTALVNSDLDFPLADQLGKAAVRGIGGTRNCDWWFTNEAVLIDTAGRYTTHESHRETDEGEWKGFIELLKKFRPRQPINGAILTISIADLPLADDAQRARHAMALRKRLLELRNDLGINFPVYVLVTKTDLLAGFNEYFGSLGRAERQQVWGFTFPIEGNPADPAKADLRERFHQEYKLLHQRLDERLPELMATEPDPMRRAQAYLLPQQFASFEDILGTFLADVFNPSKFEVAPLLRGVYFTSGTQEGTAFDRVMGAIKRYLQVNAPPAPPPGPGKSYFLKELLQQVIFRDAGVAGTNLRWYRRRRAIDLAGYALVGVLAVVLLGAWANSWRHNKAYVAEVDGNAKAFNKAAARGELPTVVDSSGDIASSLLILDRLRDLPKSAEFDIGDPPVGYRFGLYQGEKLQAATDGVYQRALETVLLPQAAQRVEQSLREAAKLDAEYSYEALKAYLMLYDPERYDADFLQAWLLTDVDRKIGASLTREQRTNLEAHLKTLFADRVVSSPFTKDDKLIAQTRERLAGVPLAQRSYARLRRILLQTSAPNAFTIAEAGGAESALVIRRASGKPLTDGISTLFTYRGYWDIFDKRMAETTLALEQEDRWVLQIRAPGIADITSRELLLREVRRLYLSDYIRTWDEYLADIRLAESKSLLQSIQMTRVLSTGESPMSRLIRGAARETDLLRNHDEATRSLLDQAQNRVTSTRERIEQLIGQPDGSQRRNTAPDRPESLVDNHFAPLRRMVTAPKAGGQTPLDQTAALINELYTFLTATDTALRSGNIPPPGDAVTKLQAEAGRLPVPFQGMLNDLSATASSKAAAVTRQNIGQNAAATIGQFCSQAIAGRYPFARGSNRDVAAGDFAQLFAPGGMMDDFFQKNLASQVDTSVNPWTFKRGVDGSASGRSAYLDAFQKAQAIRDVFFTGMAGGRTPSFTLDIRPEDMDATLTQFTLDIDGQTVRYAHGPQAPSSIKWPGPRNSNQVRLQVTVANGTPAGGIVTEGPWALHRLFDKASISSGRTPESFNATFDLQGKKVVLAVTANSVYNPLRLSQMNSFSCPGKS
ncbi:type VI secretion system protein ImpL [Variovorax boronicumulans]|uniref:Type VI secretion system protein ImpL n=1 Tax=Variovorax boronicumulans TaxID=436515 RepID=A0AAW8E794_9BURK|nr:type VI secretion system membrane subunit TssM [Variovorax boronicumulans]MDP9882227.1 type VI secretion system protein ImpL [Variovorax boronicumulans]MDP9920282.1 type VI secretion system protein ImpL [Variovorax boronicumulans]MDP9927444.1 type VI secretion system protein ImpL [Variovorax boronicumulans]